MKRLKLLSLKKGRDGMTKENKQEMIDQIKIDHGIEIDINESYTTEEVTEAFDIESFLAPFCFATKKSTGEKGSLAFIHMPRIYYAWSPSS
jgi:hypothetical protein